jgi:MoaA/NifB/PqqE/SkfB family radical SAM enzyme
VIGPALRRGLRQLTWKLISHSRRLSAEQPSDFKTVFLQTRALCNNRCSFCAASVDFQRRYKTRPDAVMAEDVHSKIILELSEMGFAGRIAYHLNCEPLLDDRLVDFVSFARESVPRALVEVTTNGILLTPELGGRLLRAGLQELRINNYSDESIWRPNVVEFLREWAVEYPRDDTCRHLTTVAKHPFHCAIVVRMRRLNEELLNRAGSSPNAVTNPTVVPTGCLFPFDHVAVTASGAVGQCCSDFYAAHSVGNVTDDRLIDIWRGPAMTAARRALLACSRRNLCLNCDFVGYYGSDIPVRLLRRMNRIGEGAR